jgi:uncharacterized membrane protein YphA (DoxX/SURF4 family)
MLRLGVGGIFVAFGMGKYSDPSRWYAWVPAVVQKYLPVTVDSFLKGQGVGEIMLGLLFITGFLTRFASVVAACFLLTVLYFMGPNDVMVRDLALVSASLALLVAGPGKISLDHLFFRRRR